MLPPHAKDEAELPSVNLAHLATDGAEPDSRVLRRGREYETARPARVMFDDLSRCARISPPFDVHHAGPVVDELLDVRGVDEPGDAFFQHRLLARGFEHLLEWKKPSSECEVTTKDGWLVGWFDSPG